MLELSRVEGGQLVRVTRHRWRPVLAGIALDQDDRVPVGVERANPAAADRNVHLLGLGSGIRDSPRRVGEAHARAQLVGDVLDARIRAVRRAELQAEVLVGAPQEARAGGREPVEAAPARRSLLDIGDAKRGVVDSVDHERASLATLASASSSGMVSAT